MGQVREYLRRTRRSLQRDNLISRRTDRTEARLFRLFVTVMVLLVPVSLWVGATTWSEQSTLADIQQAQRTKITATVAGAPVTDDTLDQGAWGTAAPVVSYDVPVTWEWSGQEKTGTLASTSSPEPGAEITAWIDRRGELTTPALTHAAAQFSGILTGLALFVFVAVIAGSLFGFAQWRIDRTRSLEWSRDIEEFLGSTSSR